MTTTATTIAVLIFAAVFCSLYLYLKANTEIQHGPRCKVHVLPSASRTMDAFWLCYHIKLPDSQLPSKALTSFNATSVSMVKDRI